MSQPHDVPRDGLEDGLRDAPRDLPHTTPHHTTPSKNHSSRSDAQAAWTQEREREQRVNAITTLIESLRPDWTGKAIYDAIKADDRPWRTVVLASIRGAALTGPDTIRHPNGLRYVNPDRGGATPTPMAYADWARAERCDNGAIVQPDGRCCPLCRMGVTL